MKNLVLLLLLVTVSTLSFGKIYDIRDYGAIGDSLTINTKAIQKAIDDNILKIYAGKTKLLISELKDADAAVLGASALGWEVRE